MRKLTVAALAAAVVLMPVAATAHEPMRVPVCVDASVPGAPNDCVIVYTDTEFEEGLTITVDGDDADPRGDGITDGYVTIHVDRDGAAVYCEDEGGFNHHQFDDDDANGENDDCRDAV